MSIKNKIITYISFLASPLKRKTIKLSKKTEHKIGLEIGGPSSFFGLKSYLPIYVFAKSVDGVNFSGNTVWEGFINGGNTYSYFPDKTGFQYIAEADELTGIEENTYDFILSCHSLEHVANPIKVINTWASKLKSGGLLFLILPDKRYTFDHKRPYTTFEHLVHDFENKVDEHDETHFTEVLELHDLTKDFGVLTHEELKKRTVDNFTNRCLHHHVFNHALMEQLLDYCGFDVLTKFEAYQLHLGIVGRKK